MDIQRRKSGVALLSVVSNGSLVVFKLIVGLIIGSVSVISEAIHSGVDLVAALIAFVAVKSSGKPADKEHPWGHGKIENISGAVEAILIFLAAGWIIIEAAKKLMHPEPLEETGLGIVVMFVSAIVNIAVSRKLFRVGRETESVALQADAWHLRTDVYTSIGVMLGLAVIAVGEKLFPSSNLHWIDPVAAIAVAMLIIKAAYDLTLESAKDLLDISLPDDEEEAITECIVKRKGSIIGYHNLKTRKAGSGRFTEFHIMVGSDMTVEESHDITERITQDILALFPECGVNIHVEPCDGKCTPKCSAGCFIEKKETG